MLAHVPLTAGFSGHGNLDTSDSDTSDAPDGTRETNAEWLRRCQKEGGGFLADEAREAPRRRGPSGAEHRLGPADGDGSPGSRENRPRPAYSGPKSYPNRIRAPLALCICECGIRSFTYCYVCMCELASMPVTISGLVAISRAPELAPLLSLLAEAEGACGGRRVVVACSVRLCHLLSVRKHPLTAHAAPQTVLLGVYPSPAGDREIACSGSASRRSLCLLQGSKDDPVRKTSTCLETVHMSKQRVHSHMQCDSLTCSIGARAQHFRGSEPTGFGWSDLTSERSIWLPARVCGLPGSLAAWKTGCLAAWLPGSLAAWLPGSLAAWQPGCHQTASPLAGLPATRLLPKGTRAGLKPSCAAQALRPLLGTVDEPPPRSSREKVDQRPGVSGSDWISGLASTTDS